MQKDFEDVSRWPLTRYFQQVVASQPDGQVLIFTGVVNITLGAVAALLLLFSQLSSALEWVHVVLLLGMPLVGFVWFVRDMPVPELTRFERSFREPWQRNLCVLFQILDGSLPWFVVVEAHLR